MRPDPALSDGDFADRPAPLRLRRSDWVLAGLSAALLGGCFLLRLVQRDELPIGTAAPAIAVHDAVPYRLDINAADWPEWMQLPGIGETLARRIVAYRDEHGPFATVDGLAAVRGVGPKTIDRFRGSVVGPSAVMTADAGPRPAD